MIQDGSIREMQSKRTCDRCYKIKARCEYDDQVDICTRCARLGHKCETKRALLQPGRPRKGTASSTARSETSLETSFVRSLTEERVSPNSALVRWTPQSPVLQDYEQSEISLIEFVLHPDQIRSLVYGSVFQEKMRLNMARQIIFASEHLKDGVLAFAETFSNVKNHGVAQPSSISHLKRSSKAIQILRNIQTSSIDQVQIALTLALILTTYNDLSMGAPTLPITRSALLMAKPWRRKLIGSTTEETDPNVICVLFAEVSECLVSGEVPVFRHEPPVDNTILDRYFGISHELLPLLYDICTLNNSVRHETLTREDLFPYLEPLFANVHQWDPEHILHRRKRMVMDDDEKQHILRQAAFFKSGVEILLLQMYRSAVTDALAYKKAVALEAEIVVATQYDKGRPKYFSLPYFIACLELYDDAGASIQEHVSRHMSVICHETAPMSCYGMLQGLFGIWKRRKSSPGLTWFDCARDMPAFGMGP